METKWRSKAKLVAYVDLVLTSMGLLFVLLMSIGAGVITQAADDPERLKKILDTSPRLNQNDQEAELARDILTKNVAVLWVIVAIFAAFTFIQLWAAIKLMNATEIGREPSDALKKSAVWRTWTIIFLSIQVGYAILSLNFFILAFAVLIRGVSLYVVYKFRGELEGVVINLCPEPPPYVSVVKE